MMKLIKLMAFGIVVCAMSAGGSWFARSRQHAATEPVEGEAAHEFVASEEKPAVAPPPEGEHGHAAHDATEGLPVVVRPRMLTPDDIIRNAMSLKSTEQKLAERERAAQQHEYRLGLVQNDIEQEQTAINSLAGQAKEQIESANRLLARILDEKSQLDAERQRNDAEIKQFQDAQTKIDASEEQNLKKLSTLVQGLDAPTAATLIKTMADNGKMDVAVRLLANFEEREASKVLSALADKPELMAELAEKFRTLQRPTKTADKRK